MKFAAKKKAAAKKKSASAKKESSGVKGRPHLLMGKKLFKVELKDGHGLREGARRYETYKSISNGMKFEKFLENGGNTYDLNILIQTGRIEARAA